VNGTATERAADNVSTVVVHGAGDPGYGATSKMLTETGLCWRYNNKCNGLKSVRRFERWTIRGQGGWSAHTVEDTRRAALESTAERSQRRVQVDGARRQEKCVRPGVRFEILYIFNFLILVAMKESTYSEKMMTLFTYF
jgi:hypothetical protein